MSRKLLSAPFALALMGWVVLEITGTPGNDIIDEHWTGRSTPDQPEIIKGMGGNDRIWGFGGNDQLEGGSHDDRLYGGPGNDRLHGGAGFDYLDGEVGADRLIGDSDEDLLIGREGNDTLIGGPGHDYLVVIGNSVAGHVIEGGDSASKSTHTDQLFFARDFNPDNFMIVDTINVQIPTNTYRYARLEYGLRTTAPVILDLNRATNVRNVQVFVTGTGNDRITGTDWTGRWAYQDRFMATLGVAHEMYVHEMFFTGAGDDMIDTRGGSDFVDAGEGNDLIVIGSGAHRIVTGGGNDIIRVSAAILNGPEPGGASPGLRSTIVYDLMAGDRIEIVGALTPSDVTFTNPAGETRVKVKGKEEFILRGVTHAQASVMTGGVVVTAVP